MPLDASPTNGGTGNTPPTPTVLPEATPTPDDPPTPTPESEVEPATPKHWIATDPNIEMLTERLDRKNWNEYFNYDFRVLKKVPTTSKTGDLETTVSYFAEGIRNNQDSAKTYTMTFDPKWTVVSHEVSR